MRTRPDIIDARSIRRAALDRCFKTGSERAVSAIERALAAGLGEARAILAGFMHEGAESGDGHGEWFAAFSEVLRHSVAFQVVTGCVTPEVLSREMDILQAAGLMPEEWERELARAHSA